MKIKFANGAERAVSGEDRAREILDSKYPDAEYGDWEQSGDAPARMLVWEDRESSQNDDGANAVAEVLA